MSPATRVLLTVLAAVLAAALTLVIAIRALPPGPVMSIVLPLALLLAAALVRWRRP